MASFSLTNATIWAHDTDLTGYTNKVALRTSVAELDVTPFGSTYRSRIGGLKSIDADVSGFWESAPDLAYFAALGVFDRVTTISMQGVEQTSAAYMFQADEFGYEEFGQVGEAAPFAATMKGSNGVGIVRGLMAKAKGNVSGTGALGSVVTLTAPSATQYIYAAFHVFTAATTITVQVQSDDNLGMSSPVTRGTIGPITTAGGTWMTRVIGPFAGELYYRFNVSAITGTFNVAGAIGVQ